MVMDVHLGLTDNEYQSLAPCLVSEVEDNSVFFNSNIKENAPRFRWSDIELGNVLGEGGFCTVHELLTIKNITHANKSMRFVKSSMDSCDETLTETCESSSHISPTKLMAVQCQRSKISPIVVKKIKDSFHGKLYTRAFIDLSCEIKFLSSLSHKNIIKLRGVSSTVNNNDDNYSEPNNCLFILLDRLYLTLDEQLQFWKTRTKRNLGLFKLGFCGVNSTEVSKLTLERVTAAADLSSALEYLHRQNIVYRDIKPENIGFDERGLLKLFDFGLCKELRSKDLMVTTSDEKLYKLTEFVGSMPYMSPEVYLGKPYNLQADVYSFGLLLYEIICLKPLFKKTSMCCKKHVYHGVMRPEFPTKEYISMSLANLIVKCWSEVSSERPYMNHVHSILQNEVKQLVNEV